MHKLANYVEHMNEVIPTVVSRFDFERAIQIVGRSNTDDSIFDEFIDQDIHDGTLISSNGYARIARHKPTGTLCLIASKASLNLQGEMQDDRTILATHDGLEKSYIVAAYRSSGDDKDIYQTAQKLRRAHRRYCEDLGERSEKHFTLYGMAFKKAPKKPKPVEISAQNTPQDGQDVEVYTNGRIAYELSKKNSHYHVRFIAPTSRKNGSFIPINTRTTGLSKYFATVSKTVASSKNYEETYSQMMDHWQNLSSKLWDEKNIFEGEGTLFRIKKGLSDAANLAINKGLQIGFVTLSVGMILGLFNPKYGLISGITAAIVHTALDLIIDEGYVASKEALSKSKEARRKLNISAYNFGEDVSDHFKIQTPDNINRLCAKMDLQRFHAEDFEFLTSKQSKMLLDHEKPLDGFRPSSLRAHLLYVHQRGFSSNCFLPDARTRVDALQSGLVRLLHEQPDGRIVLYARYRPDLCTVERLRLPEDKIQRMGDKIWAFEYDRARQEFHHAFKRGDSHITLEDMMKKLSSELLFKDDRVINKTQKDRALYAIENLFGSDKTTAEVAKKTKLYMSGLPIKPPLAQIS